MKYYILIFITISINYFSQNSQKLDENNGFRDIKLGSEISSYKYALKGTVQNDILYRFYINNNSYSFRYPGAEYVIERPNKNFDKLGNAKILGIFLSVYNNKIYNIKIVIEFTFETYELMKFAFGYPEIGTTCYSALWAGKNVTCGLNASTGLNSANNKPDISIINYTDNLISEQVKLEKSTKEKESKKLEQKKALSEF